MNTPWETDTTAKVSEAQRILFYVDVERRIEKLRKLFNRVLQYVPSPAKLEAFSEALAGTDFVLFPERDEYQPGGNCHGEGEVGRHVNAGEDDGAPRACPERIAIASDIRRLLQMPADDKTKYASPWKDTIPGKLEAFLDHLDEHRCHRIVASAQIAAPRRRGLRRQARDPDRNPAFINPEFVDFLQEEIDHANDVLSKPHLRSDTGSHQRTRHIAFRARIESRGGRGLSSPLVEGFTPDQMPVDESRHVRAFNPSGTWSPLLLWEPETLPEDSVRTERRISMEVETSTEISAAEGSEDPGEQDEIL
ncbi:hypothetical protein E4U17_002284 [Claviceps sp. LM77 group G4]|nr:hypothetical protein E4U17_002284 [Claviceps sp. LM77 group G4]KAG6058509.1 hypothetical protein E4U33_007241 [Claviceps sp. LM78 group G4]KAG6076770.1 hypothetical protein E4U16_002598 [Claviceps sp. LM84 group G4]